jgi:hypothetical protein
MPDFPIDPDLAALTDGLGGLSPAAPALNRDRVLYEAGRRAGSVSDRRTRPPSGRSRLTLPGEF